MILVVYALKLTVILFYLRIILCYRKAKKLDSSIHFGFSLFHLLELFAVLGFAIVCVLSNYEESYATLLIFTSLMVCLMLYFESRRLVFIGDTYVILRLLPYRIKHIRSIEAAFYALQIEGTNLKVKIASPLITNDLLETKLYDVVKKQIRS